MYNLPAVPAKVAYDPENPTQNQELLAGWLLDCGAAQRAASATVYTETDFYLAAYNFDSDTMTSFVSASNALSAEIETDQGVIGSLLDLAATLIPVQYRFLYYLAKPFLNALAERLFHTLPDEKGAGDLEAIAEKLESIDGKLKISVGDPPTDWSITQMFLQCFLDPEYLQPYIGYLQPLDEDFRSAFLDPDTFESILELAIKDLKFNDIEVDFGFIRALLISRALMT